MSAAPQLIQFYDGIRGEGYVVVHPLIGKLGDILGHISNSFHIDEQVFHLEAALLLREGQFGAHQGIDKTFQFLCHRVHRAAFQFHHPACLVQIIICERLTAQFHHIGRYISQTAEFVGRLGNRHSRHRVLHLIDKDGDFLFFFFRFRRHQFLDDIGYLMHKREQQQADGHIEDSMRVGDLARQ